ncbi:hypothetical protein [Bdellovibrio bacteriovorus]|uniref:hypothetical protein n=1 Tax=Bdellovibrio bacteriovorus TaxID=959 RepID=UPI003CFE28FA
MEQKVQSQGVYVKERAAERLLELNMPPEILTQTVTTIVMNRANADEYCPIQAPGMMGWIGGVRTFRLGLVNIGYTLSNKKGFSSVVSPDGRLEFFIMSTGKGTGRADGVSPKSKAPRGIQTVRRVEENQLSFPLDVLMAGNVNTVEAVTREHWCFMYYITKNVMYSEFSKPLAVDDKGYVSEWAERIILDPIQIASETIEVGELEESNVHMDVPVTAKDDKNEGLQTGAVNFSERTAGAN